MEKDLKYIPTITIHLKSGLNWESVMKSLFIHSFVPFREWMKDIEQKSDMEIKELLRNTASAIF